MPDPTDIWTVDELKAAQEELGDNLYGMSPVENPDTGEVVHVPPEKEPETNKAMIEQLAKRRDALLRNLAKEGLT